MFCLSYILSMYMEYMSIIIYFLNSARFVVEDLVRVPWIFV